jgi:hypothetical protein
VPLAEQYACSAVSAFLKFAWAALSLTLVRSLIQQHSNGYSDRDADDHAFSLQILQTRRRFAFMPCKPQCAREVRFERVAVG